MAFAAKLRLVTLQVLLVRCASSAPIVQLLVATTVLLYKRAQGATSLGIAALTAKLSTRRRVTAATKVNFMGQVATI
jgi:hypothetical protein